MNNSFAKLKVNPEVNCTLETNLWFGKYSGLSIAMVKAMSPRYLLWAIGEEIISVDAELEEELYRLSLKQQDENSMLMWASVEDIY